MPTKALKLQILEIDHIDNEQTAVSLMPCPCGGSSSRRGRSRRRSRRGGSRSSASGGVQAKVNFGWPSLTPYGVIEAIMAPVPANDIDHVGEIAMSGWGEPPGPGNIGGIGPQGLHDGHGSGGTK